VKKKSWQVFYIGPNALKGDMPKATGYSVDLFSYRLENQGVSLSK
jgi:hypothetical protein